MTDPKDTPAFPCFTDRGTGHYGLTKREYMATAILAGMMANDAAANSKMPINAQIAVRQADALIEALNK